MDFRIAYTFIDGLASASYPASPVVILEEPELGLHPYGDITAPALFCSPRFENPPFSLRCHP